MNLNDLIETLQDFANLADSCGQDDVEVEAHIQPSYPLQGAVVNVRMLKGKLVIAVGDTFDYGAKAAWDDADEEEERSERLFDSAEELLDLTDGKPTQAEIGAWATEHSLPAFGLACALDDLHERTPGVQAVLEGGKA